MVIDADYISINKMCIDNRTRNVFLLTWACASRGETVVVYCIYYDEQHIVLSDRLNIYTYIKVYKRRKKNATY